MVCPVVTAFSSIYITADTVLRCNSVLASSGVIVRDLHTSFANGLALCTVLHQCCPDDMDMEAMQAASPTERHEAAFAVAFKKLAVPPFLDPEDFLGSVDERSVMLYLLEMSHAIHLVSVEPGDQMLSPALAPRAATVAQRAISLPVEKRSSQAMERFRQLNSSLSQIYNADIHNHYSFIFRVYLEGRLNYRSFVGGVGMTVSDVADLVSARVGWEAGSFRVFLSDRGSGKHLSSCGCPPLFYASL
jgi:hypothetical protein